MNAPAEPKITYRGKTLVRGTGAGLITACCVMVILGLTVLAKDLEGTLYVLYWSWCFLLTFIAAMIALLDMVLVRRAGYRSRVELLQQEFKARK